MTINLLHTTCQFSTLNESLISCSDWSAVKDLVDHGLLTEKNWGTAGRFYFPTALAMEFWV